MVIDRMNVVQNTDRYYTHSYHNAREWESKRRKMKEKCIKFITFEDEYVI